MHIVAVGLNYRTAPVEVREKFTFTTEDLPKALQQLMATKSILECVIVATCNRTEIYAVVDRLHICGQFIRGFMEQWFDMPRDAFNKHLFIHEDDAAIEHLMRVACGLDSMVIGETQILGQVRDAFLLAQQHKTTGTIFNMLFKQAVTVAKRAHSETSIGENAVSVSYAAVELGKRIFGQFTHKTVLIIGAGKMSELTVKHLVSNGSDRVIVANRTLSKAEELADKIGAAACDMDGVPKALAQADIVISSTGAKDYVLTAADVKKALEQRSSRPLFMIDIAVPRDFDPAIGGLPNVFLYDIDDLEGIVETNVELRRKEALKIEDMISAEMSAFHQWYRTLGVSPVIRALQDKAAAIHDDTIESMLKKLPDLDERELKVIRKLTKSMLNQLVHDPILRIKEIAAERNGEEAIRMFTKIMALEEQLSDSVQEKEAASAGAGAGRSEQAGSADMHPLTGAMAVMPERLARV